MIIIALRGNSNTGKSLTIKTFAAHLMDKYNIQKAKNYNNGSYTYLNKLLKQIQDEYAKIFNNTPKKSVKNVRITLDVNYKKIGICSAGDTAHDLVLAMNAFCKNNCNMGIIAVHNHSQGKYEHESGPVYLEQIEKCCNKLQIVYIDKYETSKYDFNEMKKFNDEQANHLIDILEKSL